MKFFINKVKYIRLSRLKFYKNFLNYASVNYGSERSGMVWDMGCRYHIMGEYDIKIISFDFYGII